MQTIKNNSDTLIIVLHEIYGINQHIEKVCENFKLKGYDVICPNLINVGQPFNYSQEEAAYQHFIKNIGFELPVREVKKLVLQVRQQYQNVFLIGFSAGATIAWLCSHELNMCDGVVGYYGSRIRDYIEVAPKCPVLLLFSTEEKSFNVKEFMNSLKRTGVDIHVLSGKHGFSDTFHMNYCQKSYQKAEELADAFLKRISNNHGKS